MATPRRSGLQLLLRQGYVSSGFCTVQDEATGLVVQMVDPRPGERILDACSAPGGKALFMASRMEGKVRQLGPRLHECLFKSLVLDLLG